MLTYIIEDDKVMGELFSRYLKGISDTKIFRDAISAINNISEDKPDLILLDILLTGPDGFTFLNEIVSYEDTAKIPVVIVSSLKLKAEKLEEYNVSRILNKETMMPEDVKKIAKEILAKSESSEGENE